MTSVPSSVQAAEAIEASDCLDYGLSFLCNPASFNSVRFWVESRTTIYDEAAGSATAFYQCASCKSENTFGEKDLFYWDNYDFMPIFGGQNVEDLLIFRRYARITDRYREIKKSADSWGQPILKLRAATNVTELANWEQIRDVTAEAIPIVARTEIANSETGLRAVIEYPVKTMNISLDHQKYQVDTGPIAFPDLSKKFEPAIASISLAFVAFNVPHFADFVIEQPTPVVEDGQERCRIHHFSNPISLPAKNTLLAAHSAGV